MTPPLFLVDDIPPGDRLQLTGDEGRHAARVKRLGPGEDVLVSDGAGALLDCVVTEIRADGLGLEVRSRRAVPVPSPRLVVVQALPKGERAELTVEILTELGVDEIVPWAASRSIVHWNGARGAKSLDKWRRTAREATKQSRRAWLPAVAPLAATRDVAARIEGVTAFVLHEDAAAPLASASLPAGRDVAVVVGPEGGISPDELAGFTAAGATPVRLGDPVLRTSTAGAAAVSVLSARLGRWD